jgi:hypothetical protein
MKAGCGEQACPTIGADRVMAGMVDAVAAIIQPAGAILALLAIWLYACDRSNEFMPWVALAGAVLFAAARAVS